MEPIKAATAPRVPAMLRETRFKWEEAKAKAEAKAEAERLRAARLEAARKSQAEAAALEAARRAAYEAGDAELAAEEEEETEGQEETVGNLIKAVGALQYWRFFSRMGKLTYCDRRAAGLAVRGKKNRTTKPRSLGPGEKRHWGAHGAETPTART